MKAAKVKPIVVHGLSPVAAWFGAATCCGLPVEHGEPPVRAWLATATELAGVTCPGCKRRIKAAPQLRNAFHATKGAAK